MRFAICALSAVLCLAPLAARAQETPRRDPAPARDAPFPDVPRDHWAFDAVEEMRKRGILRGYPPQPKAAPKKKAAPAPRRPAPKRHARR